MVTAKPFEYGQGSDPRKKVMAAKRFDSYLGSLYPATAAISLFMPRMVSAHRKL
jgi:hypothetical protein